MVLALSGTALISGIVLAFPWRILGAFTSEGWRCAVLELAVAAPATVLFWLSSDAERRSEVRDWALPSPGYPFSSH